jgi:hypothetical protein
VIGALAAQLTGHLGDLQVEPVDQRDTRVDGPPPRIGKREAVEQLAAGVPEQIANRARMALEVRDFLADAIKTKFSGTVTVATDRRSYHTFAKGDEMSTEQISMEWASRTRTAATPPCLPERLQRCGGVAPSARNARSPNCSVRRASKHK